MTSQILPLAVFQAAAFAGALGQLLYKKGASNDSERSLNARLQLFLGMVLYIGVTLLFLLAYRLGGEVSILYPTYGATFVWGLVLARLFSRERITAVKALGTSFVMGGICLVTI